MLDIANNEPAYLFETKSPIAVRVVEGPDEENSPWWTVMLPGHPETYVLTEDVLSTSEEELELVNREGKSVPSFRRIDITRMSDNSMDAVENLLELIAKETERIDLHEHTGDVPIDDWCDRVLEICPKLQELQLRQACLTDLRRFVFAAEEGRCHLRELLALIVPTGEDADHVRAFLDALSDPVHPLTANLRDLDLRLLIDTENPDHVIEPVLRMLRANRRLLLFHLNIQLPDALKSFLPTYKSALKECFDELVMIRTGPMDIDSKAAFLSLVGEKAADSVCEALSLLALVARGDVKLWKKLLLEVWSESQRVQKWFESKPLPTEFEIGVDVHEMRDKWGHHITRFSDQITSSTAKRSPEYSEVHIVGLDNDAKLGVSTLLIDDKVSSWPVVRATLTAVQHGSSARTIELDIGESDEAARLAQYEEDEEDEEDEDDDDEGDDEDDHGDEDKEGGGEVRGARRGIRQFLTDLQGQESEEDDELEDEEDDDEEYDHLDYAVWLDAHDRDQSELWQWIAFTIFSRHADHNIDTLELCTEQLMASEVGAMRRVLNAPNTYAVVRGRPGVMPRKFVPRQLVASRFVLQDPREEDLGPPFLAKKPIAVRVLETPDKGVFRWYEVLLPGYGDAWVHEDDVVSTSEEDLHLTNRQGTSRPEIQTVEILSISDDSMDPVADLIALIGHSTKRIEYLEHMGDRGFEDGSDRVMLACPKLEVLDMDGGYIDNLNVFEAAARAGYCHLRELNSPCTTIGDNAQHRHKFFEALSDRSHALTEHLRELEVGLVIEAESHHHAIEPVIRMLAANRTLLKIQLTLRFREAFESLRPAFQSAFDNRKIEHFVIRTGPLDLRCMLAFLSAVDHKTRTCDSALSQLDSSVLSIVLQFAADGCAQVCSISYEEYPRRYVF